MALTGCAHTKKDDVAAAGLDMAQRLSSVEEPRVVKLANGLTVLVKQDDRFPLVNVRLYVHAGAAYEEPGQEGISHLLEHMVFKGSETRAPGETAREIESVGGSLNAGTSWDYTVYYVEVPDSEWKRGMDVVKDMGFGAKIDPAELEPERQVVLSELERGEDQPSSRLFKTLASMTWKGTSYEWPIIGYRESVQNISADDIHAYIDRLYQPQSMLLVVAGKVDEDAVLAEAERLFGPIANTRAVVPPKPAPVPERGQGPEVRVVHGKWNKVYLAAGFPIPDSNDSETVGLEMLAHLLGGDDTSLLYRKFKYDERLVDDIGASAVTLEGVGMFYVYATLDADKVTPFWRELVATLDGLNPDEFTDRELDRAKLNLADSLFTAKETLSGLASKMGALQFFYGSQQKEGNYLFELSQVNRRVLRVLAERYLAPDKLHAVALLPEGTDIPAESLADAVTSGWKTPARQDDAALAGQDGEVEQIALPGGSSLVLMPDATLPYTAFSIYWPGGDGELAPEQQGLAEMAAKVITRGTPNMTATQIEDFLSDRAASLSAMGGRDVFALNAKYPSWFAGDILPLIDDMLTRPTWPASEADRAKQDQVADIKLREDQPLGLAFRHMFPFLFETPPYSYYHQGDPDEIARFSPDDLKRFWNKQSRAPFVLAVCGRFDSTALRAFAGKLAQRLSHEDEPYEFVRPAWNAEKLSALHLPDRNQAHLLAIFPTDGTENLRESAGLTVLRAALAGQSGLLFRDLRDKQGLGYTVTAFLWQAPKAGFMAFYIGTDPEKVDQAEEGFKRTIDMLHEAPLPDDEVQRAKNVILGEYYQEHQTLLSRSRQAANLLVQGLAIDQEKQLVDLSRTLEPGELRELAKRYLIWDKAYIMKVQP
jgi:zinc protease